MSCFKCERIDSITEIPDEKITHKNLEYMYGTGIAINDPYVKGDKKYRYRHGIQTELGDIEKKLWIALVMRLIEKDNGQKLYGQLLEWEKDTNTLSSVTEEDLKIEVLRGYVSYICDNKTWWDYIRFNMKYRPEKLDDPELMTVITESCNRTCKVASEQINYWEGGANTIPCPFCNKGTKYTAIK